MYRHILIATDGSDLAGKAVAHAIALARSVGAALTVVTATELWSIADMVSAAKLGEGLAVEAYEGDAEARAKRVLDDVCASAKAAGIACTPVHVPDSEPAAAILRTAQERGCDLIVLSTHARTGLARLLAGSQAAEVIAGAATPVLVCR